MEPAAAAGARRCPAARVEQRRSLRERPVGDRRGEPRQVLEHRLAGAEVEMANLRVAHLPGRQPDGVL